jgi:nitrous oxidase accessory protein NosD
MIRFRAVALPLIAAMLFGCGRQSPVAPTSRDEGLIPPIDLSELRQIEARTRIPTRPLGGPAHSAGTPGPHVVEVPAGSANALAAAFAAAGVNGTVLLKSGLHTESGTVEITQKVTLAGEVGAVLESATSPVLAPGQAVQPALWVHGASGVVIHDIEMRPATAIGGCGVLLDGAEQASVFANNIHDIQYGVIVDRSDRAKIWSNRVACSTGWLTGAIPEALGITVDIGEGVVIADNRVTGALFGIWPCDGGGQVFSNKASGCLIGIILCKVPANSFLLPSGSFAGPTWSTYQCTTQGNETFGNFTAGILAIDGAHDSRIVDNNSHDNGTYDVEMSGDSFRFGFLTPTSVNCNFVAGSFPGVHVKNCGNGNTVVGGVLVDNTVDPCN